MLPDVLDRIDRRLRALGLSDRAASVRAGLSTDAIRNLRRAAADGKAESGNARTYARLAEALGTTPVWLLTGQGSEDRNAKSAEMQFNIRKKVIAVRARISSRSWSALPTLSPVGDPLMTITVAVPGDLADDDTIFGVTVSDGYAPGVFLAGEILVCRQTDPSLSDVRDGTLVLIERTNAVPLGRIEVRRVRLTRSGLELHAIGDDDPPCIDFDAPQPEGCSLRVLGIVHSAVRTLLPDG